MKKVFLTIALATALVSCNKAKLCGNSKSAEDGEATIENNDMIDIYRDDYSFCLKDSCYTVVEEPVTREMWEEAHNHRLEYNFYRDTTDFYNNKSAEVAAFRTLSNEGQSSYVWTDLWLCNIGRFTATEEDIVDIWYANEMNAVFVKDGVADSCIICGSHYSAYGTNRIYVGCQGFDCDNFVWLFFYQTIDKPYHQTKFLCEYRNESVTFEHSSVDRFDQEKWYSKNPMIWYKDMLYYRAMDSYDYQPKYYRLQLHHK